MDKMIYVSMAGASEFMNLQTVVAHNLANVTTTGFRADLLRYESVPVAGDVYPSRVYAVAGDTGVNLSPGPLRTTGRDLDIAVDGDGYIAVEALDGGEAYTRAGNLQINQVGQLLTGAGEPVLGNGGPIAVPPFEKIDIAADGTISIRPVGQDATALVVVDRIRLVRPDPALLVKNEQGLLVRRDGEVSVPDASVRVASGVLEGSNVNAVEAMVTMLDLSRQFELQVKMMETADRNEQAAAELLRLGG